MADNWQLKAVLSAVDKMSPVLKGVGVAAKSTRKYLSDVASSANALTSKIGLPLSALSGILGGFSAMAIQKAVVGYTDVGEAIYKGSLRAGMSVEEWQRMKYVAEQSGVAIESLEGASAKLNKQIGDAAAGKNKGLSSLLKHLRIDTRDANGQLRSSIDMLPQLADAFARNKNPVVQARMGMALFGKSWQEMMPLLMEGSAGIEANLERFKRLKGVLSLDDVKGAKELGDKFKDLEMVTKGFQNTIAKELVPVLGPLVEDIVQWGVANKKLISLRVKEVVKDMVAWAKGVDWAKVAQGAQGLASGIGTLVGWLGGAKNALIALVVFMNAGAIMAMFQMGGAVLRLVGFLGGPLLGVLRAVWALMMANPISLLIAAVVGLGVIIYQNWDNIVGYISSAWDRIKAVFDVGFFSGIIQVWLEAWQGMANGILGIIKTILPDSLMPEAMKNFQFSFASDRASNLAGGGRPSLVNAGQVKASGQIEVSFKDAPPGMRVEQAKAAGDVPINTNVGYRSFAMGMP